MPNNNHNLYDDWYNCKWVVLDHIFEITGAKIKEEKWALITQIEYIYHKCDRLIK